MSPGFGVRSPVFGVQRFVLPMGLCVLLLCATACTLTPEGPDEPGNIVDQKQELVGRINDSPTDLEAHADLLRLQIRDGDLEGAEATVSHALKHNGADFRAHMLAAQYHRWQADLISAERSLFTARDLAPNRLEPRVALSGLYHQCYLEEAELEQRRIALELAEPALREEFTLDLAYALSQLGRDEQAEALARPMIADQQARADNRGKAHSLLAEIALRKGDGATAIAQLAAAIKLRPKEAGLIQFAARLVTAVEEPAALSAVFDDTLATQDVLEARWAALFGKWMLSVRAGDGAAAKWLERLEAVAPGHPDILTRQYQVAKLDPRSDREAEVLRKQLEESDFGVPDSPTTLPALLMLWRAEDALRIGAPDTALEQLAQLEARETGLPGLRVLRTIALFKAREDETCLGAIDAWLAESKEPDQLLQGMRWWIMLRTGRGKEVLVEVEGETQPTNATVWIHAVARFHVYRGASRPKDG